MLETVFCGDHMYCSRQHYVGTAHIFEVALHVCLFEAALRTWDCIYFLRQHYKSTVHKEKLKIHSSELFTHCTGMWNNIRSINIGSQHFAIFCRCSIDDIWNLTICCIIWIHYVVKLWGLQSIQWLLCSTIKTVGRCKHNRFVNKAVQNWNDARGWRSMELSFCSRTS
jgi:hypothetical protein